MSAPGYYAPVSPPPPPVATTTTTTYVVMGSTPPPGAYYAPPPQQPDLPLSSQTATPTHPGGVLSNPMTPGGSPGAYSKPAHQEWSVGLCDCCANAGACYEAWCCTPCQVSRQCNMLENGEPEIHWPYCVLLYCCGGGYFHFVTWLFVYEVRNKLRARYNIEGSGCSDCCAAWCCTECTVQQAMLQMAVNNEFPGATCCYERPSVTTMR